MLMCLAISALLAVQCDSYLVDTPRNVVVTTGASVTLPCKASDGQSITWLAQDGSVISKGTTVTMPSKYSVDSSESGRYNLVIKSATFGIGGTYQCQQTGDSTSSYYAEVTILDGTPKLTSNGPDGNNIVVHETMTLTCSIPCQGNMLPTFMWSSSNNYDSFRSMYTATQSTSILAQSFVYISYTREPYHSQSSFSCLVFFDRVNVTDSTHASNAPSYIPIQLSYTLNVQVPVNRARVSANTYAFGVLYTQSDVHCTGLGYRPTNNLDSEIETGYISPAPTYSWQVSTTSTDLRYGPNSKGNLTITRDMIGRTIITCTASNIIRGVTYSATSDPLTVVVMVGYDTSSGMSTQE